MGATDLQVSLDVKGRCHMGSRCLRRCRLPTSEGKHSRFIECHAGRCWPRPAEWDRDLAPHELRCGASEAEETATRRAFGLPS